MNRNNRNTSLSIAAITAVFSLAFATTVAHANESGPCKKIVAACESAGFVKGGHKKGGTNGVYKDCLEKILAGQPVEKVTVPAEEVAACKAKKETRRESKKSAPAAALSPS